MSNISDVNGGFIKSLKSKMSNVSMPKVNIPKVNMPKVSMPDVPIHKIPGMSDIKSEKYDRQRLSPVDIKSDKLESESIKIDDSKMGKCMIFITCDNAKKIRKLLAEQIEKANLEYNEKIHELNQLQEHTIEGINQNKESLNKISHYKIQDKLMSYAKKEFKIMAETIKNERNKHRGKLITGLSIPAHAHFKSKGGDPEKLTIVALHPGKGEFEVSYIYKNKPVKLFLSMQNLCVGSEDHPTLKSSQKCSVKSPEAPPADESANPFKGGSINIGNNQQNGPNTDSISTSYICS